MSYLSTEPAASPASEASRPRAWKARPALAWSIRAALLAIPLAASWLAVRLVMDLLPDPSGAGATAARLLGAVALSMVVFQAVRWPIRRFGALSVLFTLSLTFPDAAPSRTRAFLRPDTGDGDDALVTIVGSEGDAAHRSKRLAALVTRVSRREARSGRHGDRVRGYAELIAREMGLPDEEIERLRWGALLHDVGLLDVPDTVLDRRDGLTAEDRVVVEQHPVHAIGYLAPFADWLGSAAGAATDHHERWDGTGYPSGTRGDDISLAGRIVAVADAYDAMTAARSYQKPRSPAAARRELVEHSGTQFDPAVVRAFLNAGIHERRMALGTLGALLEVPRQLLGAVAGGGAGAGAGASGAVALAASVTVVAAATVTPAISASTEAPVVPVERIVDAIVETSTTTTAPPTTTTRPPTTTTAAPITTSTTSTTTSTTTTTVAPTTTAPPPPTTTAAPTTTAPPTTTTTLAPTTTTTAPPYPTVPPPPPPEYPTA